MVHTKQVRIRNKWSVIPQFLMSNDIMELLTSWAVSRKSPPTFLPMHCQVGSSVGTLNRYQTVSTEAVPVASLPWAEHAQNWALWRQMTGVGDCQPKGCSRLQAVQLVTGQEHLSRKQAPPAEFVRDRVTIQDCRTVTLRIQRCLAWSIFSHSFCVLEC